MQLTKRIGNHAGFLKLTMIDGERLLQRRVSLVCHSFRRTGHDMTSSTVSKWRIRSKQGGRKRVWKIATSSSELA